MPPDAVTRLAWLALSLFISTEPSTAQLLELPTSGSMIHGPRKKSASLHLSNADVRGYAGYIARDKKLVLHCYYKVLGLIDGPLGDRGLWRTQQELALTFWPTDVIGFGENRLAVAGLTAGGRAIVDVIDLAHVPTPAVTWSLAGEREIPELVVPVLARERVFDEDAGSFGLVPYLFRNLGRKGSLFVMSYHDGDIHALNTKTRTLRRVASCRAGSSDVLTVPHIETIWSSAGAGKNDSFGRIYWFYNPNTSGDGVHAQVLVLLDAVCDGLLDSSSLVREWTEAYGLQKNYAPHTRR